MSAKDSNIEAGKDILNNRSMLVGDDVQYHRQWCSRWQKYGHDRIYFNDTERESWGGYVDLEDGAVNGDTPIETVEVEDGRVEYRTAQDKTLVSRPL